MLQRLAGGVGTVLIGSAAEQNGLRAPMLTAVALAFAGWCVAFANRNGIASAFRQPRAHAGGSFIQPGAIKLPIFAPLGDDQRGRSRAVAPALL